MFPECPCVFSVAVAFPDAKRITEKRLAKLAGYNLVSVAPTNLMIRVSSATILFETIARHRRVCAKKKTKEKHYR